MSDVNPYQSPSTPVSQWEGQSPVESAFSDSTHALAQTKPWVRLISVLGFLFSGLMLFAFLAVLGFAGPGGIMVVAILPFVVLFYFIPSLLLWNYASRIGQYLNDGSSHSLVSAVSAQKSFWKYIGIMVAIILVFYGGIMAIAGIFSGL